MAEIQLVSQRWQVYNYNQIKDEIPGSGEGVVVSYSPSFPNVNVLLVGDSNHTVEELVLRVLAAPECEYNYVPEMGQAIIGTQNLGTAVVQTLVVGDGESNVNKLMSDYFDMLRDVVNFQFIPSSNEKDALLGTSTPSHDNPFVTKNTLDEEIDNEAQERQSADATLRMQFESAISEEAEARQHGDDNLTQSIDDEINARIEADAETLSEAKEYTDQAQLATQTWKSAVKTKEELPVSGLNNKINYLCRVIADPVTDNNGVYQAIAGWVDEPVWTYFSDNADWVDELELAAVVEEHDGAVDSHEDIRQLIAGEVEAREAADSDILEQMSQMGGGVGEEEVLALLGGQLPVLNKGVWIAPYFCDLDLILTPGYYYSNDGHVNGDAGSQQVQNLPVDYLYYGKNGIILEVIASGMSSLRMIQRLTHRRFPQHCWVRRHEDSDNKWTPWEKMGVGSYTDSTLTLDTDMAGLQGVIDSLPKQLDRYVVIRVKPGVFTDQIRVERFSGSGELCIRAVKADVTAVEDPGVETHKCLRVLVQYNTLCLIHISGFTATSPGTHVCFYSFNNSGFTRFYYCNAKVGPTTADDNLGIYALDSDRVWSYKCTMTNKKYAFYANRSTLYVDFPYGEGNAIVYRVYCGGQLFAWSDTNISGTTMASRATGGMIVTPRSSTDSTPILVDHAPFLASTTDLTANSSALATGQVYLVYA